MRVLGALVAALALALLASACGGEEGIGEDATVTVYAAAGACQEAKRALENEGGRVDSLRIRIRCVAPVRRHGRFDLAAIGGNARRAVQDSTTVAYIGELEPAATRFSETILEEASIAQLPHEPGSKAMHKVLEALENADTSSGSLRESVHEALPEN